ncbi:MAG TPA: AMP-binding protein, partial [Burkholderiaceae bacterium]|nr:AMP-binding protein [Burkholderiaceae bacterium]
MAQDRYAELHAGFAWKVPTHFNIAEVCCTRWARQTPDATAIIVDRGPGRRAQRCTYAQLDVQANRLAHALVRLGARRGDRIAIVMPQRVETAAAHIAAYRIGAVAMPLSMLFGPEALEY